ncbi:hypothetical protein SNK03_007287 [Fusarium graminearum]
MTGFNSSVVTQPFNLSVMASNGTEQLKTLVAPSWVSTPNVRGTLDILQSCILTLIACIYTALHLDVPKKTTWQHLLWQKFKWAIITLFAPEVAVFVAAAQLRYAWILRSALRKIQKKQQESPDWTPGTYVEINLKYAFFIVMGAVRFDVHDILSLNDLDESHCSYFKNITQDRRSVRSAPASVIWLAERGHWIKVRKQDIDDKSKANTIQKALVLIQVLWMVTQCIARRINDLPVSLLEIHTIVHVVCAVFLYACWFEKPLDVQEAIVLSADKFRGEIAAMLQRHFYSDISYKMALFPPKRTEEQLPPTDSKGSPMRWIHNQPGQVMKEGDIMPSGLALSAAKVRKNPDSSTYEFDPQEESTGVSFVLEPQFMERWRQIFTTYPFEGRGRLTHDPDKLIMRAKGQDDGPQDLTNVEGILYIPTIKELEPPGWVTDGERLFWETESIFHLHWWDESEEGKKKYWKTSIRNSDLTFLSWQFILLAIFLTGVYGGVHMSIWGQVFPSNVEDIMWKVSCLILVSWLPAIILILLMFVPLLMLLEHWEEKNDGMVRAMLSITGYVIALLPVVILLTLWLAYISARIFIIVESFLCLRRAPVGVFLSPEWVELFPHF